MRWKSASVGIVALALFGCGGNSSTGSSSKDYGFDPSSGSSEGNGSATGNGSSDPSNAGSVGLNGGTTTTGGYVPQTCSAFSPCPSGEICSTQGSDRGVGYCVQTCTLPEGVTVGKSTCIGDTICVRIEQSSAGACVLPCKSEVDCPTLVGLEASCASLDPTGPHFCVWGQQATPGGG
jgi:hypothetical protein